MPTSYQRSDAIFNISRMGLLLRGLATNNSQWLRTALADKIHQPYRQKLIVGYEELHSAAISAGAYGLIISGAGPTLLALTHPDNTERVVRSLVTAWTELDVEPIVRSLAIDTVGARVL